MSLETKAKNNGIFPGKISEKECSDSGMAFVLICLITLLVTDNRHWAIAAVSCLVLNMAYPKIYTYPAKLWLGFSALLGGLMSKVILSVIFYAVLTPIAIILKIFGHDPLASKKWKASEESVFITRNYQYKPEDIEHPY